ncbi:MAG: hypothetical protein DRP42_06325 [Tenericutes bacterium]|nr:MAG: hypothetical protein DRP42_06325 [Mycoplasmatota bacterium]
MGTATEAKIQHLKAKAKGEGIIFSAIERQLNSPLSLPQELIFRFDYRDADEEIQKAEVHKQKIENIRKMWESSPNRQALVAPGGESVVGPDDNVEEGEESVAQGNNPPSTEGASPILNQGMISTEEARILLAREGLIPADFIVDQQTEHEKERVYAVRNWGPYVRIYRDGSIMRL